MGVPAFIETSAGQDGATVAKSQEILRVYDDAVSLVQTIITKIGASPPQWERGSQLEIRTVLFILAIVTAAQAQDAPTDAQKSCGVAAATEYNKANLALLQQGALLLSVEATIAQRRLQEQFCLRFVQCVLSDQTSLEFMAAFDHCLEDEALEKYEAEPRK